MCVPTMRRARVHSCTQVGQPVRLWSCALGAEVAAAPEVRPLWMAHVQSSRLQGRRVGSVGVRWVPVGPAACAGPNGLVTVPTSHAVCWPPLPRQVPRRRWTHGKAPQLLQSVGILDENLDGGSSGSSSAQTRDFSHGIPFPGEMGLPTPTL